MDEQVVHYDFRASPYKMFATGRGACSEEGKTTYYLGLVTCPECKECIGVCEKETSDGTKN